MPSFMSTRLLTAAALLATVSVAHATSTTTTINGSYAAFDTTPGYTSSDGAPTINTAAGFLSSPFSTGALTVGHTTSPTAFLEVSPTSWPTNSQHQQIGSGTVTGSITVNLTLTDPSSVIGVSSSAGGYFATLTSGVVQVIANYAIDYANSTDCISWTVAACTLPSSSSNPDTTNVLGDTLMVTFGDHAVLDVNLYNWSDWTMAPQITFDLMSGPTAAVPEPMSIALLGAGLIGIRAVRRRPAHALPAST